MLLIPQNHNFQALALALLSLQLGACAKHSTPAPAKPLVTVVDLHSKPLSLTTELPGRVTAYRIAEVRPQVNGVVLKRLFKEGDLVAAGQQLYQIDSAPYEATLASARASLAHARASVTAAKLTAERYQVLAEAHAVSRQDYDNALATLQQDEADVASGEAAVQGGAINLAYTKVYSPISGRTGRSSVTEGALVTTNQTSSLVTVTQLDPVYVDLTQPSATVIRLKRKLASGQILHVEGNAAAAKLLLEDGTAFDGAGTLQFSEVTVDQGTGSVTLRAIFPNPQDLLMPGMFVRATIEEGMRQGAVLAPQQGIAHSPDGAATALIVGNNDTVEKRSIELDGAIGDQWVVTNGLAAGDRLIVGGLQRIKPGDSVAVRPQIAEHGGATGGSGPVLAVR
jgi:membrane fusion protein, multidrug efflux system